MQSLWQSGVLDPQGPVGAAERLILLNATAIMLAIIVPVIVLTLGIAWWFRAGNTRARYLPDWEYSGPVELVVWSIPALVVMFLGGIAWVGAHNLDPSRPLAGDAKPLDIQVVSLDWKWLFIYPEHGIASVNHLVVPAGTPLRFAITSAGVMNSFFVPQLGSQIYAMSGMATRLYLQADKPGKYPGISAQFSGAGFSDMRFVVEAVPADQFATWLASTQGTGEKLDVATYGKLGRPGLVDKPVTFGSVAPGVFEIGNPQRDPVMFGKLSWDAIPFNQPIPMAASLGVILVIAAIIVLVLWKGWTRYLWDEWITSVDHKRLGVMYALLAFVMLIRGFVDALMMRSQLALAAGGAEGYLPPEHYNQIFSAHGTIMIFFVAMPFVIGLMNFAVPLQLGIRDVAFPVLNSVSFWLTASGVLLVNMSLVIGAFARTGWLVYPPLSELAYSPDVGVDYYLWALQISGVGTLLTGINFTTTILKLRAPGMGYGRMPIFCWTALASNLLIVAAFPILTATFAMLLLDRYLGFHFFTTDAGGHAMMYINLIWAWGHPEVYILILPAFGVFSEVISTFSGKPLFGYRSMVAATLGICVLSFMVWLHHFFTMGSGADVNAFFGVMTMIIAVPTGVKVFNWLFTLYGGRVRFSTPLLWTLGFMCTFVIGGMTGVLLSIPPVDFVLHNSLFLVAHFHNVIIGGVLFGAFAGYIYWFPKAFGFTLDERLGKAAFWCWLVGFYLAFMPLYALGLMGATRRMQHYHEKDWQPLMLVAMAGALVILAGIVLTGVQLYVSIRSRAARIDRTGDPWNGRTLEWSIASPPPPWNFSVLPRVRGADAYWGMKQAGKEAAAQEPEWQDIHLPRSTPIGVVLAFFATIAGFAMIWHIWWLAIFGIIGLTVTSLAHAWRVDNEITVPARQIADHERQRRQP